MSSYLADSNRPPDDYENCPVFLKRYLDYLKTNLGKRPLTLSETMLNLREYCQYVHYRQVIREKPSTRDAHKDMGICNMEVSELAAIRHEDLEEYICFLDNEARNAVGTIKKKVCIIRSFFTYLIKVQEELGISLPDGNPAAGLTFSSPESAAPTVLSPVKIESLLEAISGETGLRDKAMILLIVTTGLSLSEVAALNRNDITGEEWLQVKGSEKTATRYVYLTESCRKAIQQYLVYLQESEDCERDNAPLLCSSQASHKRLTPRMIRGAISKAGSAAGLGDGVTPRVLRDTAATILAEYAGDAGRLQVLDYLGYTVDARFRKRLDSAPVLKPTSNPYMRQIVKESPLGTLGCGKGRNHDE